MLGLLFVGINFIVRLVGKSQRSTWGNKARYTSNRKQHARRIARSQKRNEESIALSPR